MKINCSSENDHFWISWAGDKGVGRGHSVLSLLRNLGEMLSWFLTDILKLYAHAMEIKKHSWTPPNYQRKCNKLRGSKAFSINMSLVKVRIHRTLQLQRKIFPLTRLGKRYFGKKSSRNFTWRAPLEKAVPFYLQYCCYNKAVGRAISGCGSTSPDMEKYEWKALIGTSIFCNLKFVWPICTFLLTGNASWGISQENENWWEGTAWFVILHESMLGGGWMLCLFKDKPHTLGG